MPPIIGNLTETIDATMDYVEQAVAGGEECDTKTNIITDNCDHLVKEIAGMQFTTRDAAEALKVIKTNRLLIGENNAEKLRNAVHRSKNDCNRRLAANQSAAKYETQDHH